MNSFKKLNLQDSSDPLQLRQQQEKPFDINEAFDFSQNSDKLRHPSEDGTAEQLTIPSDGSSGSGIGEAIIDVLLQPNVAPVSSGSGGGTSGGWRDDDDDDEKNKHSYKPRKRSNAKLHTIQKKYVLLREFARQNKEWADKADLIEYLYTDEAEHQEDIERLWENRRKRLAK